MIYFTELRGNGNSNGKTRKPCCFSNLAINQNYTHQPHSDVRVRRAGHHLVILAAAVETPYFVLVGVQRLHALVGLYGPQLY